MASTPNLKQLLLKRNDWIDQQMMTAIRRTQEHATMSPAQSRLLAHLGGRPMSLPDLARKLSISRQAVHKTVSELVRRDILVLADDPERGNAKQVRYTDYGKEVNRAGARIIGDIEKHVSRVLGPQRYALLVELLSVDWAGNAPDAPPARTPTSSARVSR